MASGKLASVGYIADEWLERLVQVAVCPRPGSGQMPGAILVGPPGGGKSFLAEAVAKALELPFFVFQFSAGVTEDMLFFRVLPSEGNGVERIDSTFLAGVKLAADGKKVVILLDELDKARPSADVFLNEFLQSGRLSWTGACVQVPLENLIVFITANNNRELDDSLVRRLMRIDVPRVSVNVFSRALADTHGSHPFYQTMVGIYAASLHVQDMAKPITIQEARRFLDALSMLGDSADIDKLVLSCLTKVPEVHSRLVAELKKAAPASASVRGDNAPKISLANARVLGELVARPKNVQFRDKGSGIQYVREEVAPERVHGVLNSNDAMIMESIYHRCVSLCEGQPGADVSHLPAASFIRQADGAAAVVFHRTLRPMEFYHVMRGAHRRGVSGEVIVGGVARMSFLRDSRRLISAIDDWRLHNIASTITQWHNDYFVMSLWVECEYDTPTSPAGELFVSRVDGAWELILRIERGAKSDVQCVRFLASEAQAFLEIDYNESPNYVPHVPEPGTYVYRTEKDNAFFCVRPAMRLDYCTIHDSEVWIVDIDFLFPTRRRNSFNVPLVFENVEFKIFGKMYSLDRSELYTSDVDWNWRRIRATYNYRCSMSYAEVRKNVDDGISGVIDEIAKQVGPVYAGCSLVAN